MPLTIAATSSEVLTPFTPLTPVTTVFAAFVDAGICDAFDEALEGAANADIADFVPLPWSGPELAPK